jgi:hypothetical protein
MMEKDLIGYVLVVTEGGSTWIGKPAAQQSSHLFRMNEAAPRGEIVLENAYVFRVQPVQMPGGQMGMQRSIWPLEAICGHPSLIMDVVSVAPASVKSLSELDPSERAEIVRWIEGAEQIRTQGRAAKSGLVLAGNLPRPS